MQSLVFNEFEAYADAIRDADVQCSLSRLDWPTWSLAHGEADGVHIQWGSEGSGNLAQGTSREDGFSLYLQRTGTWGLTNGERLKDGAAFFLAPRSEFCIASADAHDWASVFVPTVLLLAKPPESSRGRAAYGASRVIAQRSALVGRLHFLLQRWIASALIDSQALRHEAAAVRFRGALIDAFRRVVGDCNGVGDFPAGRPAYNRRAVVRVALAAMDEQQARCQVDQLAAHAEVSERTLRTAFLEYFGMTPQRYLTIRRLNAARRALQDSEAGPRSVAEVAAQHGFWDFGRFAQRYRELFGEPPRSTLRRRRQ
jgi:AraC family ethanolamine operon transcriptional activator